MPYRKRLPEPSPEQRSLAIAIGAFLAGRISETDLKRAYGRATGNQHLARDKINLMRRLRRNNRKAPPL